MAPKLGEILIGAKIIDQHQLDIALSAQQKWGGKLGEILVNRGLCSEELLVKALSRQLDIVRAELDKVPSVPSHVLERIPLDLSIRLDAIPLELRDGGTSLVVAMSDPTNIQSLALLEKAAGCPIHALLAGPKTIAECRSKLYGLGDHGEVSSDDAELAKVREREKARRADLTGNRETIAFDRATAMTSRPPVKLATDGVDVSGGLNLAAIQAPDLLRALVETLMDKGVFSAADLKKHLKG